MRDIPVYSHALTRRDEGVLDSLVLDEFDPYVVHTLNVSIESSHTAYSTDCHSVLVLLWTVYTAPGKAVSKSWPLSAVPLCNQFGSVRTSLCLQIRVSWSEQWPWSSREILKAAVKGSTYTHSSFQRLSLQLRWLYIRYIQCINWCRGCCLTEHTINWLVGPYLHYRPQCNAPTDTNPIYPPVWTKLWRQ